MAMSRKNFNKMAAILADRMERGNAAERYATMVIAGDLAAMCVEDNPRFDTARFFKACGLTEHGLLLQDGINA